jgi:hypothetical protein
VGFLCQKSMKSNDWICGNQGQQMIGNEFVAFFFFVQELKKKKKKT